jgi:hypothetical protein
VAQSLNDQIVGTWTLSQVYDDHGNGNFVNPWGPDVEGQLTYTKGGRFSLMIIAAGRPKSSGDPRTPVGPALGYFGTYVVRDDVVVHDTERATFPNWEGLERPLTSVVKGNALAQTAPPIGPPGQSYVPHLNWTRAE